MNYTALDYPDFFRKFLNENISDENYIYTFVSNQLKSVLDGYQKIYSDSLVNINDNGNWILVVNTDDFVSIYGSNWTDRQIDEVIASFNLHNYGIISGTKQLVLDIFSRSKIEKFTVGKNRHFYRTNNILQIDYSKYIIKNPDFDEVGDIAHMLQSYYQEEYKGANDKSIQEMYGRIYDLIMSGNIFILFDELVSHEIIAFCTIKDTNPGILYTKPIYRNRGYGRVLLNYIVEMLLKENEMIFLMTDTNVLSSNKLCENLGFENFYEYISVEIE